MNGVPRLLKVSEVAEILRISNQQVYNLITAGKMPAIRVSERRVVVSEEDLLNYIERARTSEPSQLVFMIDRMLEE